jgi:signal transduction histidine kinase
LFEPFWQARDRASLGTGLGLSIARGIVEAHGGRFSVRSTPGEGTTFSFTLPSTPVVSTLPPSESRVEMQSR